MGGAYDIDGLWKPTKEGLGMKHCIDELNKIYGKDFIRYQENNMESEKVKEIKKALEFQRDGLMYLENNCAERDI